MNALGGFTRKNLLGFYNEIQVQATMLSYLDVFRILTVACVLVIGVVLLLRTVRKDAAAGAGPLRWSRRPGGAPHEHSLSSSWPWWPPAPCSAAWSGRTTGPRQPRAPRQWSEPLAGGETSSGTSLAEWWRDFHDPELDSLVARALDANLDLRLAQARVREARAERGLAGAALAPSMNVSGSTAREKQSANQPLLGGLLPPGTPLTSDVYQAGFDASWELDLFGGNRRGAEAADADLAAAGFSLADAQVSLVAEVARNYVTARGYQQRLAIARENLAAQRDIVTLARSRYQQGFTSSLEPDQAATVLAQTEGQVPALEAGVQTAVHHLGVLLGQDPGALRQELAAAAPIPQRPAGSAGGPPRGPGAPAPGHPGGGAPAGGGRGPGGRGQGRPLPQVLPHRQLRLGKRPERQPVHPRQHRLVLGPSFRWPIFDAGRVRANIRVQDARQEEALACYEKAVLTGFEDVENALVAYAKEQARNVPLRAAVASSSSALEVARQQYASGLTSFINVLDAERTVYQAQDTLVQSDQAVDQDLIALCKALGGGWPEPRPAGELSRKTRTHAKG